MIFFVEMIFLAYNIFLFRLLMSTALVFPIYDTSTTTKETNTFIESAVKGQGKVGTIFI